MAPTVFVCGTTGTQGGALARALIAKGATVHSVTRDPSSAKTKAMTELGVKFWPGDFDNEDAVALAIAGTSSVFLNFYPVFTDFSANARQARLILSVARAAGVSQVVYTSGLGAYKPERMSLWEPQSMVAAVLGSKTDIEQIVREAGFKNWTILRPGVFTTNYAAPFISQYGEFPRTGVLDTAFKPDTKLPLVTPKTIGALSAAAILDPAGYHAREIDYADEILTPEEIVAKLSAASGKTLKTAYKSDEQIESQKAANPFIGGQVVTREIWKLIDMDQVHKLGVPLGSFDEFLEENKDLIVETFAEAP